MTFPRTLAPAPCLVALLFLIGSSAVGFEQPPTPPAPTNKPLVDADMNVFGDPSKPGMYVYRNRFAPGRTSRPHFHDQDRYVTVIKGTWWTGEGDVFQPDKMVPIKAGGFMFHPAGYHHYDGAKDEEVIVQIMGMGPVKTTGTEKK
jgi:quercetin dioxygenase-like cupin family protein